MEMVDAGTGKIDVSLDQTMDEREERSALTPEQKRAIIEKLRRAREELPTRGKSPFARASRWVILTFAYEVLTRDPAAPPAGYGASFPNIAKYVDRKRKELEAEEKRQEEEAMEDE